MERTIIEGKMNKIRHKTRNKNIEQRDWKSSSNMMNFQLQQKIFCVCARWRPLWMIQMFFFLVSIYRDRGLSFAHFMIFRSISFCRGVVRFYYMRQDIKVRDWHGLLTYLYTCSWFSLMRNGIGRVHACTHACIPVGFIRCCHGDWCHGR
jgi:hypothetical protein